MLHQQSEAELKAAIEQGQQAQAALSKKRQRDEEQCLSQFNFNHHTPESVLTDEIQTLKDAHRKHGEDIKAKSPVYQEMRKKLAELSTEIRSQDQAYSERSHLIECLVRVANRAKRARKSRESVEGAVAAAVGIAKAAGAADVEIVEPAYAAAVEIASVEEIVNSNTSSDSSDSDAS